ncbi:YegP family protein [Pseudomonas sp. LFM046]|uniref:YegP family protein n=1 Tax=Pseudomonas sp. LFM046 TaxID=1608357 RepID=UPI0005CFBCA3|nr:YegP family protein [Pseudomonas sp. LFM046]
MSGWFELRKNTAGTWRLRLKAADAQTLLDTGIYESRAAAEEAIVLFRENSRHDERYTRRIDSSGKNYFKLRAANKEIIARSHLYDSEQALERAIETISRVGGTQQVKEA